MEDAADPRTSVERERVALVTEAHERLQAGDLEGFAELVAEEATWVGIVPEDGAEPATCRNRDEIVETIRQNMEGSLRGELVRAVEGARGVAVEVRIVAPQGPVGGWFHAVETAGGRIVRMQDASTWEEALAAAGAADGPR